MLEIWVKHLSLWHLHGKYYEGLEIRIDCCWIKLTTQKKWKVCEGWRKCRASKMPTRQPYPVLQLSSCPADLISHLPLALLLAVSLPPFSYITWLKSFSWLWTPPKRPQPNIRLGIKGTLLDMEPLKSVSRSNRQHRKVGDCPTAVHRTKNAST